MDSSIGVVVPVYNRAQLVLESLESIARQTLAPARVIVVDDGSTDDTVAEVARWLADNRERLSARLVEQTNQGVSSARNRGLEHVRDCSLVAFLDSDDRWPYDFLARTSRVLARKPTAVAATTDRIGSDAAPTASAESLAALSEDPITWMLMHGAGIASATLFRRGEVERLGGFDEALLTGEDVALFLPLALKGPWLHVPGLPTHFARSAGDHVGQEGNLSSKFHDNTRRWARVYENFVLSCDASTVGLDKYRRLVSKAWYRAGRELASNGDVDEAQSCFRTAIQWDRFSIKARRRLAGTYFTKARRALARRRASDSIPIAIPGPGDYAPRGSL